MNSEFLERDSIILYVSFFAGSKFYSGRNKEQIEVRKYLLSFGAEYFVFQVAIQKFKDQDIYIEL